MSDAELPPDATDATRPEDGIPQGRLARAAPLVGLATRTAGEAVVAGLRGKLTGTDGIEFHERTAERYAKLLGRSRGVLMKAGQMLSFTPTNPAVPAEFQSIYHTALSRLRDDAPPMESELARSMLELELGQRAESVFAEFQWEPLAAASVGQVHAARLHDGREVAVKVQYPGVAEAIRSDLKNTELLATFLSLTIGGLSPLKLSFDFCGMAREMSARIAEELDYRLEAANQAEFADIYRGHPFIHVPEVVGPVTPEDAFAYWRGLLEMFWAEQPFKLIPEHATRFAANAFSPRGPAANALRHSRPSPEYTVTIRTEVGVVSVIAHLQACNYWESMAAEYFDGADPLTELGKRERAFFEQRQVASHA